MIEVLKLFGSALISGSVVAVVTIYFQQKAWRKQKRIEQKIGLVHDWENFIGAVEYACLFHAANGQHPDSIGVLLTRQKGLLTSIGAVFGDTDTKTAAERLRQSLDTLGEKAWLLSKQPDLRKLREDLLERMNKTAFE
jgi:hypothetical protein